VKFNLVVHQRKFSELLL